MKLKPIRILLGSFSCNRFVLRNAPESVNFTEPRGIVCLLKYDWQHFLHRIIALCASSQLGDRKTAEKIGEVPPGAALRHVAWVPKPERQAQWRPPNPLHIL